MINVEHLSRLGPALKDLRWASRMTQGDIRDKTGMNAPQLSRYENGHEVPTLESLVKYLHAIGCDLCDLQQALVEGVKLEKKPARPRRDDDELRDLRDYADMRLRSSPELRYMLSELLRPNADGLERLEQRLSSLEERLDRESA